MEFGLFACPVARSGDKIAYGSFIDTVIEVEQLSFESISVIELPC